MSNIENNDSRKIYDRVRLGDAGQKVQARGCDAISGHPRSIGGARRSFIADSRWRISGLSKRSPTDTAQEGLRGTETSASETIGFDLIASASMTQVHPVKMRSMPTKIPSTIKLSTGHSV